MAAFITIATIILFVIIVIWSFHNLEDIEKSIECFKKTTYYTELKKLDVWKESYECNLLEGKD